MNLRPLTRAKIKLAIALFVAVPLTIVLIILIRITGAISSIPAVIGRRFRVDDLARAIVLSVIDVDRVQQFRDDLLYIFEEHYRWSEQFEDRSLDRWSLLRQLEDSRSETKRNLQEGEFIISLLGGVASILLGIFFDIRFAGVALALVLILFSLLVVSRVVITDILSYNSFKNRNEPVERLILMRGWNQVQVDHGTALVLATFLLPLSNDFAYELGLRIAEWFGRQANPRENKRWAVDDAPSEDIE